MIFSAKELEGCTRMKFPEGNTIPFMQDMRFWDGLPSEPTFYVIEGPKHQSWVTLIAEGHGLKGSYGNGSIFVDRSQLFPPTVNRPTPSKEQ